MAFFSKKSLPSEEKYSFVEKECLAIKLYVQTFHMNLLGKTFVIQTDHCCLEWLDRILQNNS